MEERDMVYYPQDEMNTFLLPVTRGCSWNRCAFCAMYKDIRYEEISLAEMEKHLMNGDHYSERVFLTGADPLTIGFPKMMRILALIRRHLPICACVASYASIHNLKSYRVDQLVELKNAGLRQLYIGFETGDDELLKRFAKAHHLPDALTQAAKLNEARLAFNTIILTGLAGQGRGEDNAIKTAAMINQFTTRKIITMNLQIIGGTELDSWVSRGEFRPATRRELLMEMKRLLEALTPSQDTIFDTTHPTNLIRIKGILPRDQTRLITELKDRLSGYQ